ncbi:cysteine hydrolase family protein [Azomonas macrocytogenes]|uniref:Nicotinamidase-related amidase n=1 Tax=Azomonas macrocytogenes TaxID=69962 RepID=A0A839T2I7_AZOMA|nr:cysteine hydrolase family protein [Azomonas macrocytogenes]MBB3103199.1 nicotinamidase-related amidase [Azomonas macrocytogenes]
MQDSVLEKAALLIIDMQVAMYQGPDAPWRGAQVLENINTLIQRARLAQAPIFAAQHTGPQGSPAERGSPGWTLLPGLALETSEDRVFEKHKPSCFADTALHDMLGAAGITHLLIAGMKTQYCVDTTCRAAAELGYRPVLIADAHTCMDAGGLSAEAIVRHHNLTLAGPFARLLTTAEVRFR